MNQHAHDKQHHHPHHNAQGNGLHKDWRVWLVVGLMLAAMLMYVLSDDESIQPAGDRTPGGPIDSPPVEAAP